MGRIMFNNDVFDQWLNNKSEQILSKVDKSPITTEEMIILLLKAQTNHFAHMDIEFRNEFKAIGKRFDEIDMRFEAIDKRFEAIDKKFDYIDKRFDRLVTILMWSFGLLFTAQFGFFLKILEK